MSSSRDRILGRLADVASEKSSILVESTFSEGDLWVAFASQLGALGGRLIDATELQEFLRRPCFVEEAVRPLLSGLQFESKDEMWDIEIGVSLADLAIAETGSLVVSAGPRRRRVSSLVPPKNVMLVKRSAIVARLSEAIPLIPKSSSAIITGPSRTADIEGILVKGVHGPGELMVYVYD